MSGWKGRNRSEGALGDLLKLVKPGDILLVEDGDRWSREKVLDSLNALRNTVRRGLTIVFLKTGVVVDQQNFDDPSVLIPTFFSSFLANAENEKRSQRIQAAMKSRRKQPDGGRAVAGRLPAWLTWDEGQSKPAVNQTKANVVKRVFALSLAGEGCRAIADRMIAEKVPSISNDKGSGRNSRTFS